MTIADPRPSSTSDGVFQRRWLILGLLCASLIIVIVGNSSLNVALPTLANELDASTTDLQWMVDSYALVFAGMLLTAGALGDRFGRKGALQLGLVLFAIGVVGAAFSGSSAQLIAARAVMGFGAAFVMPSTLSILTNVFPASERAKAIAIWAGVSGGGAAVGPVASGFLLEHFWWGSVFLVNLPIIVAALVAGRTLLPKSSDPAHAPLDPVGAALSVVGLSALIYAIIEAPNHGWTSGATLAWFGAAVTVLAVFALWERSRSQPMLDLSFFADRRFSVSSGGIMLVFFAMFGALFLMAQFLQLVLGYSPLEAGVRLLPMSFVMMAIAPMTPRLVRRFGPDRVAGGGLFLIAAGLAGFNLFGIDASYAQVLGTLSVLAAGMALTMSPMTTELMAAVPPAKAGVGSAMNDTTRELGGALGVALLGSLVASQYTSSLTSAVAGLPDALRPVALSGISGAVALAEDPARFGLELAPDAAAGLRVAAETAFVDGLGVAALIAAAAALIASGLVLRFLPSERRADREPGAAAIDALDHAEVPVEASTATIPS